jgi:hypothetical protein
VAIENADSVEGTATTEKSTQVAPVSETKDEKKPRESTLEEIVADIVASTQNLKLQEQAKDHSLNKLVVVEVTKAGAIVV